MIVLNVQGLKEMIHLPPLTSRKPTAAKKDTVVEVMEENVSIAKHLMVRKKPSEK
jgi:hypothetical protein